MNISDNHQLSHMLGMSAASMYKIIKNIDKYYSSFTLKSKSGKSRSINMPNEELKMIQQIILNKVIFKYDVSKYATAYMSGAKLIDNAKPHLGKHYILKIDLKDFFEHITYEKVYKSVFNTKHFTKHIGLLLCDFCCYKDALPQGAPTSPAISNIVMKHFDDIMGAWCEKNDIAYTRYSDDITFSADKPIYHAYEKAKSFLEKMGFEINDKKTRFLRNGQKKVVTGVVINEKLNPELEYRRKLRKEIYYVLKYGPMNVIKHQKLEEYVSNKEAFYICSDDDDYVWWDDYKEIDTCAYLQSLMGKINYVLQINPSLQWFKDKKKELSKLMRREYACKWVQYKIKH